MGIPAQGAAGYYVWGPDDASLEVHISLDVIESLGVEIMRGFGAVPKRGAEVGGLLLGTVERDSVTVVRVEDFEPVPCGYTRGPSYLLSAEERSVFEEASTAWRQESEGESYAVGYFRSHTRDGLALGPEDIELLDQCFPGPSYVALLVKPFATRASTAGFFFRDNGAFQETTLMEFPFRRRELTGEAPPEHRPLTDRSNRRGRAALPPPPSEREEPVYTGAAVPESAPVPTTASGHAYAVALPARSRLGSWVLIPLSFIFLLLGVALGAMAVLNVSPRGASKPPDYSLGLATVQNGDDLSVRWNGDASAVKQADHGVLEIHDGSVERTVDLDAAQLLGGRVAYHNATDTVSFHLTVYLNSRVSVTETLDWHK